MLSFAQSTGGVLDERESDLSDIRRLVQEISSICQHMELRALPQLS